MSIEYFPINFIFINTFGQQFPYNQINITVIRIIGKTTRISHHTRIDTFSSFFCNITKIAQLTD